MQSERMTRTELRAGASLSAIFGLRMLGLFFILPVFAVHAPNYAGGDNLTLVGIALGAYGLTQAMLQIPFGAASDRWGRKPVLYVGLRDIRRGQPARGIGATTSGPRSRAARCRARARSRRWSWRSPPTSRGEAHRTKVMAMIGSTIGFSFALSLVARAGAVPRASGWAVCLRIVAVLVARGHLGGRRHRAGRVPCAPTFQAPGRPRAAARSPWRCSPSCCGSISAFSSCTWSRWRCSWSLPRMIVDAGLDLADHWMLYLPVVLVSFALMVPPILYADRRNRPKPVLIGAVAAAARGPGRARRPRHPGIVGLGVLMLAFFVAFNVLEAMLPSLVSRIAPAQARGAAIGVYNTTQTLGLFCGGLAGGWIAGNFGARAVFGTCTGLALAWLAVAAGMRARPRAGGSQPG